MADEYWIGAGDGHRGALPIASRRPSPVAGQPLRRIPSQSLLEQLAGLRAVRRDQLAFLTAAARRHGDIFRLRILGIPLIMVNHPDYVHRVLVDNRENYDKEAYLYRTVRPVLRSGLIGAVGGESWQRQRRLMQPTFHRHKIAGFTDNMTEETSAMLARWAGRYGPADVVSVLPDIGHVVLRIVTRTLFGADVGPTTEAIEHDFTIANEIMARYFQFPFPPLSVPTPRNLQLRRLIGGLFEFTAELIEQRRDRPGQDTTTLLSILANAVDEESGHRMDAVQLRDEVTNLMVGGYETTTNTVAYLLNLLARHTEVQERMFAELTEVLDGQTPNFEELGRLTYTRMVVDETLRMYSPAWQTMRHAVHADQMGGYHVPAGSGMYINFSMLHRHPEFWPDPERFDPDRFLPENAAQRPKSAYTPFASGPRNCLGKHFALTEVMVIATMILQAYRLRVPAGAPPMEFEQLITLRPRHGVQLHLERR